MNHRCSEHSDKSGESPRLDAQKTQVNAIEKLNAKGQPHDKH